MKYIDFLNEIRDLGFEDEGTMSEYTDLINNALTRSMKVIASTVKAPTGKLELPFKNLGTTTTAISAGSTIRTITVNGKEVTVEEGNMASYRDASGDTPVDTTYVFLNSVWQVAGTYDLAELSKDANNNILFDDIDRITRSTANGSGIATFLDYDLEDGHLLHINPQYAIPLTVWYKERILPVTTATQNDYELQVAYPCEPLLALLTAHYVWLDDDERKAVMYWNEFDQLKQEIIQKIYKTKARIVRGI